MCDTLIVVQPYTPDSDGESNVQLKKHKPAMTRAWVKDKTYDTSTDAESAVKDEGIWSRCRGRQATSYGDTVDFRCNGASKAEPCDMALYLIYHDDSPKVHTYSCIFLTFVTYEYRNPNFPVL